MKTLAMAFENGLDRNELETFIKENGYPFKQTLVDGLKVDDADGEKIVAEFLALKQMVPQEVADRNARAQAEKNRKNQALASMLITSGFSFEGYHITKYSGYISGDDAVELDRGVYFARNDVGDGMMAALAVIRRNALKELKEAAYELGCNAVIGVDFDYLTLDAQIWKNGLGFNENSPYVFGVTANGNAVVIEKSEE